jgi:site-specific DNA-methyltransferase (adenine-specific)
MNVQLFQGDCLEIMPTLAPASVDLVLCDLPYGITRNKWDSEIPLESLWPEYKRLSRGVQVLTGAQPFTARLVMSNVTEFKYSWVWKKSGKTGFLNAKKQPLRNHEDVLVFGRGAYNPQGLKPGRVSGGSRPTANWGAFKSGYSAKQEVTGYPATVLEIANPNSGNVHPTQKPVALMEYLVLTYTNPGDTVLDNCMGSGTTGVACVNTGRAFIGIEKDPTYFEIAQRRIREAQERASSACQLNES